MSDGVGIGLLVRAALPAVPGVNLLPGIRKSGSDDLEGLTFSTRPIEVRREHVRAYAAVCGFPDKDTVPLTYPHILGFPLHLKVMTDPAFPFPAIGGVHLTNTITTHRPIAVGETLEVTVHPENLQPHAKGRTVDFVTDVTSGGELVWEGRSTYLRRGKGSRRRPEQPGLRRGRALRHHLAAARRPRPAVRRGVRRPQPDPPLPVDGEGARLQAADRARHVDQGPLRRGPGEPAARRRHRRGGLQEARVPARDASPSPPGRRTPGSRSR